VFSDLVHTRRSIRLSLAFALALVVAASARAAGVGDSAPAFSLPTAGGDAIALDTLRGKIVYVDFWASWCGPCKRSFPWMNAMNDKYGTRGLAIVAINVDRKRADAERFLAQVPASFTVVYDPAGGTPSAYAVRAMPSSYIVDAGGRIVDVEHGFREDATAALEEKIRALLGEK
jgi:thiol-disulfide isomerase/thioredoxin